MSVKRSIAYTDCPLRLYEPLAPCAACGASAKDVSPRFDHVSGHVLRICGNCHFRDCTKPLFAFAMEPFVFARYSRHRCCPGCGHKAVAAQHVSFATDLFIAFIVNDHAVSFMNETAGVGVATLFPLMALRCTLCYFSWLETPHNRDEPLTVLMPKHACTEEAA